MVELRPDKTDGCYTGSNISANVAYGGDTLNVAVYLARQGIATEYITALGDDRVSDWMLGEWRSEGVGCKLVRREPGKVPGLYLIDVDNRGERSFYYWRANSPASRMLDDDAYATKLFSKLLAFDNIYLSGITLAIFSPQSREKLISFLQEFRQQGGRVFFDNNFRTRQWADLDEARRTFEKLYKLSDVALPTLDDEYQLYGDATAEAVIERLKSWEIPEIVLKNGESGCTFFIANSAGEHVPAAVVEKVVDTTAAGDSFNAGYIGARLRGVDPVSSAVNGNKLASLVVQHRGAIVPVQVTDQI